MNYFNFSDLVSRIRVGYNGHHNSVKVLKNKFSLQFLFLLQKIGLIRGFFLLKNEDLILVYLKYTNSKPSIHSIELMSKPTKRLFWTLNFLSKNYRRHSIANIYIISTSKGLLTQNDIILTGNFSGEVICKIKI